MASLQAAGIASTSNNNFSLKASVAPVLTAARDPRDPVKAHLAAAEQGGNPDFCPLVPWTCLCCESTAMCTAHWQSSPVPQVPFHHSWPPELPSPPICKVFSLPEQLCLCWDAASVLKIDSPLLTLPLYQSCSGFSCQGAQAPLKPNGSLKSSSLGLPWLLWIQILILYCFSHIIS